VDFQVKLSQTLIVEQNRVTKNLNKFFLFNIIFLFQTTLVFAQAKAPAVTPTAPAAATSTEATTTSSSAEKPIFEEVDEGGGQTLKLLNGEPSKRRIRRHLSLIAGVKHDEELQIPNVPLNFKGQVELFEMQRIKGTDIFRILPTKEGNGIITIHNKKTGQIYVELRVDIRKQDVEKNLREIQALLADVEGIEYKIVNSKILLDGFVLLPNDLIRIGSVLKQFGPEVAKSLVRLSPLARKKIVEYIARDVNNPEVTITAVGDFIKLEGIVNNPEEKQRVADIVNLYLPDIVTDKVEGLDNVDIKGRRVSGGGESLIINLITIRKQEDKVEPPPKMIQVVVHFVEFSDRYLKQFTFNFEPSLSTVASAGQQASNNQQGGNQSTFQQSVNLINNFLPKLNWARTHGFLRVLDTASVLTQDKFPASINRSFNVTPNPLSSGGAGGAAAAAAAGSNGTLGINVTPTIKGERTGLIEMQLTVNTTPAGGATIQPTTNISTKISVHDRASAAFGGIINKKSSNDYGAPNKTDGAIITLNHGKKYEKSNGNFVVFVTPIIKSSASAGVEQIKKKFRMKE
jgi:pilus assembly protein CpaC